MSEKREEKNIKTLLELCGKTWKEIQEEIQETKKIEYLSKEKQPEQTVKDVRYILTNKYIWLQICKKGNMELDDLKIINVICIDKTLRRYEIQWKDLSGIKEENYGFTIIRLS